MRNINYRRERVLVTGGSGFIGSAFCEAMANRGESVCNIDLREPSWFIPNVVTRLCDIRNTNRLVGLVEHFQPDVIVHLAARTDLRGKNQEDYSENVTGVSSLIRACRAVRRLRRLVIASSMLVCKPGYRPEGAEDFRPNTAYGHSKVQTELLTRREAKGMPWVIVRPTTVWGEGHCGMRDGVFRLMRKGLYRHPRCGKVWRSYGYIRNVVQQLEATLYSDRDAVVEKMFYLGDDAIDLGEWVDKFSKAITGKPVAELPWSSMKLFALSGDLLSGVGLRAPMTSYRLGNMTRDNIVDLQPTFRHLGPGVFTVDEGIANTAHWLHSCWGTGSAGWPTSAAA